MIHKLVLTAEITGLAIGALIAISFLFATVRAVFSKPAPKFNPQTDVAIAEARAAKEGWLHRALVAFDIALNVIVLRGAPNETISSHAWRASLEGHLWGKLVSTWLDGFQRDHGIRAASGDLERSLAESSRLKKLLGQ